MLQAYLIYVFKCGCRSDNFYAKDLNWGNQPRIVRFCPSCYNPALSPTSTGNQACVLSYIESACSICGCQTRLSKKANNNIRIVLCLQHRHLRNRIRRSMLKEQCGQTKTAVSPLMVSMKKAVCPLCRAEHKVPAGLRFATKTPWKYCPSCDLKKQNMDDNFAYGDDILVNGQRLIA